VRRLPVLQDGQVTGIVSQGDLALPDPDLPDGLAAELVWVGKLITVAA
jgi:hypothetical protein